MSMIEVLVLTSPIQRTRQRLKRFSAARVIVSFGQSLARPFGRVARLLDRSIDRSFDRSINLLIYKVIGVVSKSRY